MAIRNEEQTAVLLLVNPKLSLASIKGEWRKTTRILENRLPNPVQAAVVIKGRVSWRSIGNPVDPSTLQQMAEQERPENEITLSRPDYEAEVLKVLLNCWLKSEAKYKEFLKSADTSSSEDEWKNSGFYTKEELSGMVGCSYRTLEKYLLKLGEAIDRRGNKGLRLRFFPKDAFMRVLVLADHSRSTLKYTSNSLNSRSIDSLTGRLKRLNRSDIAIGGVTGSMQYLPQLNITGAPRLDISVHAPEGHAETDFVRKLDPALKPWVKGDPLPSLCVHFVKSRKAFFWKDSKSQEVWADPVECLLDLHEARLEEQANQFRNAVFDFTENRKISNE